jgi:hypothetical protein
VLTWALTRLPSDITVPRLPEEVRSDVAQARGQALHTLSKIKDRRAFEAITPSVLRDRDVQLSLSRALVALGAEVIEPMLRSAATSEVRAVRAHAIATARLLTNEDAGTELGVHEARRQFALKDRPA